MHWDKKMGLAKKIDHWLNVHLKRRGIVLMRVSNPSHYLGRRMKLFRSYGIDLVLDIGANAGQYASRLRSLGYAGDIMSFEPMTEPYEQLCQAASRDPRWTCLKLGLSDEEGTSRIHVSENSVSSSLLPMLDRHSKHAPASKFIRDEVIEIKRLDALPESKTWIDHNVWMKIDVQGLEHKVLAGAAGLLGRVGAVQMEMSLVPLYEGQLTLLPMLELMRDLGFELVGFEPGFDDKVTGEYLQVDGIFRNRRMRGGRSDA